MNSTAASSSGPASGGQRRRGRQRPAAAGERRERRPATRARARAGHRPAGDPAARARRSGRGRGQARAGADHVRRVARRAAPGRGPRSAEPGVGHDDRPRRPASTRTAAAVRSTPGGTSSATRSPGATPWRRARPPARGRGGRARPSRSCGRRAPRRRERVARARLAPGPAAAGVRSGRPPDSSRSPAGGADGVADRSRDPRPRVAAASGASSGTRWTPSRSGARRRAAAGRAGRAGAVGEDRVARSPQQQRRARRELAHALGDRVQRRRLGWSASTGMSATKSPTARRRAGDPYGAANASRTSRGSGGRDSAVAARTNTGVAARRPVSQRRARAPAGSAPAPAARRLVTAVLVEHDPERAGRGAAPPSPARRPRPSRAPTVDRPGPSTPSASVSRRRGRRRARRAGGAPEPLGEPHPELVDRDDPPARAARRRAATPQVATTSGCRGRTAACRRPARRAPLSRTCQVRVPVGVGDRRRAATTRVEPGQPGGGERRSARGRSPDDLGERGVQPGSDAHAAAPGRRRAARPPAWPA